MEDQQKSDRLIHPGMISEYQYNHLEEFDQGVDFGIPFMNSGFLL
jgi:hypothetical protein